MEQNYEQVDKFFFYKLHFFSLKIKCNEYFSTKFNKIINFLKKRYLILHKKIRLQ